MDNNTLEFLRIKNAGKFIGSLLIWLGLTASCIYSGLYGQNLTIQSDNYVIMTFVIAPFLIMGALYGYLISMFSFLATFITIIVVNPDNAYYLSTSLVSIICFSLFAQYFWFKKPFKSLGAVLITIFAIGIMDTLCLTVIATDLYDFGAIKEGLKHCAQDSAIVFVLGGFLYWFFKHTPDSIKSMFPIALGYTKAYEGNSQIRRNLRKTRVSVKLTAIIVAVELILGIFVCVFISVLFPDIKGIFVDTITEENTFNGIDFSTVESGEQVREMITEGISNIGYRFDNSVLSFDIKMILLMLCIGVPIAAIMNFYTKMTIGGPIGIMSDFMLEFAMAPDSEKGSFTDKVDAIHIRNNDEIGVMYESLKSTVYETEAYVSRLKEEQELEKNLEVAQKASEAKSSFLSNMSHEIRTPINAVLGMNEMILRECNDEQILEYSNNVKSAGNSLLGIVNDILDFSKIEAGKMEILPVQYHLGSLINDLVNMIAAKAKEKNLELEVNVNEHIPVNLTGDEVRIKQCVTNVLTNAVKYTESGKVSLNVDYKKTDDKNIMLKFQVVDTGIGIKEEDLSKLFSPFERIEEIRNRSIEGTGLGMSIVKKLLAMMDTKLIVKSEYGKGSDFSFEVKQEVISWDEIGNFKERYKEFIQSRKKYHQRFNAPDAEILVVDDTEMNLTVIKSLLKQTQISIDTADSGAKTLDMVTKKKYDVIFLDHRMPEMDGIETYERMKVLEGNLNMDTPVIALTANALSGAREEYVKHGFSDYLSKPVNGSVLEEMLEHYLPVEKILSVSISNGEDTYESNLTEEIPEDSFLNSLSEVDLKSAIANCGSVETLEKVVKDFYSSIDDKANAIEEYLSEEDIRNYTVLVHALKSSARLIGANELSEMARELEDLGNADSVSDIKAKTPALLERYRGYKEYLRPCIAENSNLPLINENELNEALKNIKDLVEVFDFDSADSIMKMLEGYSMPTEYQDRYEKLLKLITAVDRDGVLKLLE